MSHVYQLKFMFDWGSGVCLWSTNKNAEEKFGDYPVGATELPVSQEIKDEIEALIERHDEAFNWDNPSGSLLWDDNQIQEFLAQAKEIYLTLCNELGEEYEIEFINQM